MQALGAADRPASLKEAVRAETERVERELIQRALDETGGNVTQAARKLKISRKSLQTKMKELGLRTGGDPPSAPPVLRGAGRAKPGLPGNWRRGQKGRLLGEELASGKRGGEGSCVIVAALP